MSEYTSISHQGRRIPIADKRQAADLLRAGMTRIDVARRVGISTATVTQIARQYGIQYVRTKPGAHWGRREKMLAATVETEINWCAVKAGLRWGKKLGA